MIFCNTPMVRLVGSVVGVVVLMRTVLYIGKEYQHSNQMHGTIGFIFLNILVFYSYFYELQNKHYLFYKFKQFSEISVKN